ncbi:hypothetical protein AURDEDRAFT_164252 [Auricularia subglabra TFB-10046 SS5]|nr:hypothetical protein AURDEDRAFT_164252 [Auricularia subglabra TFB-10046 SS5]
MSFPRELVDRFMTIMRTGEMEALRAIAARDFAIELLPASVGHKAKTLDEIIAFLTPVFAGWPAGDKLKIEITEYVESAGGEKATAHARTYDTVGPKNVPYENEYMFIFTFVDEGGQKKVSHIKEFCDSSQLDKYLKAQAA